MPKKRKQAASRKPSAKNEGQNPSELEQRLGYKFRDKRLLTMALTHPSAAYEGSSEPTNQRLEFLGDAVLQLVLTRELFDRFEGCEEGPLTKARAKMVNSRTLAERARNLGIGPCLIMGKGEEQQGGRDRESCLGDAFEAVLGAMFLDSKFETVQAIVLKLFSNAFSDLNSLPVIENPKGELQELLQSNSPEGPVYHVESVTGPDHDRVFVCKVSHCGLELARGQGKSKKAAESDAAAAALAKLNSEEPRGRA